MFRLLLYISILFYAPMLYAQPDTQVPEEAKSAPEDSINSISDLSAVVNDQNKVILTWKVRESLPEFFAIERSDNGKSYELVTILSRPQYQPVHQWVDEAPRKGRNVYRIRYSLKNGPELYSRTTSVLTAGYIPIKFYPNPADQILIVRTDVPVDVQITDGVGKIRISQSRVKGLHTINVSSLEKGIYQIRFSNKLTNVMTQEQLIKN